MSILTLHHDLHLPKLALPHLAEQYSVQRLKVFWQSHRYILVALGVTIVPLMLYALLQLMIYPSVADAKLEDMIEVYANYSLQAQDVGKHIPVVNPSSGKRGTVVFSWDIYTPSCLIATIDGANYGRFGIDHVGRVPKLICNTRFDHLPRK